MGIRFIDPQTGKLTGSTELGRAILAKSVLKLDSALSSEILSESKWRKTYQGYFAKVAKAEFGTSRSNLEVAFAGLAEFESRVQTDRNENLLAVVKKAWQAKTRKVETVAIRGAGTARKPEVDLNELSKLVLDHSAEQGILETLENLKTQNANRINERLFIALAGGAEYSPTRLWLDWSGSVAIVARARKELWLELIKRARAGAGTLYVPVLREKLGTRGDLGTITDESLADIAGLDLTEDYEAITGWIAQLAEKDSRGIVLGSYAYASGADHIRVQAVQHCIVRAVTDALPKSRVALSWLATPTDSHVVPQEFATDIEQRYQSRTFGTRFRDLLFIAKRHRPEVFSNDRGEILVLIDPTSSIQGSSYALAKRLQRWLAYQQEGAGRVVSYQVSPPATTNSVLSHRLLRATYRGAPHFGLNPFTAEQAVRVSALLLLGAVFGKKPRPGILIYCDLAVHGGIWRSIYNPADLWRVATFRGILGYFRN